MFSPTANPQHQWRKRGSTPGTAAAVGVLGDDKANRDGILEKLLSRLDKIEAFIKTQRMGGSTAAYYQPVEDCAMEVLHTLALCQVYQAAADSGKDAFAAAVEQHGAPAVVRAGAASGGVDISAYGFAVAESDESEDDEIDVREELRQLRSQIDQAVTFGQASVPSASSLSFASVSAGPQQ
ncbi:hypothetical protein CYMTET_4041 [Cymbomonas tetramitiformis]|uniref:Uncharacterized protein n=1 Tax=Cymbomonas tetramitiformis TaxID=36881 RepID=A0AAE0H208_9CHLO|nr:hypothetical protein CYMTET_4041 [Cymbomonas tetramitiformis]